MNTRICNNFHSANEFCQDCGFIKELHIQGKKRQIEEIILHAEKQARIDNDLKWGDKIKDEAMKAVDMLEINKRFNEFGYKKESSKFEILKMMILEKLLKVDDN